MEEKLIKMLKEKGIKNIKSVLHSFKVLEDVAFNNNIDIKQLFSMYEISTWY